MQESPDHVSALVTAAKSDLARRSERLLHVFSFVPDEKLGWQPAPTSRSALRIVAHCAVVCQFAADLITGKLSEAMPSVEEFFKAQGEAEKAVVTRDEAVALLKDSVARLSDAIATLTADSIESTANSPFGPMPLRFWIFLGQEQLAGHTGQLEYLQTIWGDIDNHLG